MHFRSHVLPVSSGLLSVMTLAVATVGAAESTPYVPTIAPASAEAARGTDAIGLPPGF